MLKDNLQAARVTLRRFHLTLAALARSRYGPRALVFAIMLLIGMLGVTGLNVVNSYVGRDFMSAIQDRNMGGFWKNAWLYIGVFVASTVVGAFYRYAEQRLGLVWREQLTRRLAGFYINDRAYYRLDNAAAIANPDQRIAEDVNSFTTTTLSFTLLILNGTLSAISFSGVLWTISPALFGVAVLYAGGGTLLTILLGKPLIRLNYRQLDVEAAFRAELIHIRENGEAIALSHREGRFKERISHRIRDFVANFHRIVNVTLNLNLFTNGYNYMIQIIPALIVAPAFISGETKDFGVITQSAMAFSTLLGALSLIVTQFQQISAFGAVTARLSSLSDALQHAHTTKLSPITILHKPGLLEYDKVTLTSEDGSRKLVTELSLSMRKGEQWVITGGTDEPKVAIMRATAGIWQGGSGSITRPPLDDILFLQERPYLPPGIMRDILVRADIDRCTKDDEVLEVMAKLGLADIVKRLGGLKAEAEWNGKLSIGEQHLFSVARILLSKPSFALLDRPGSSLEADEVEKVLGLCKEEGIGVLVLAKNGESHLTYDGRIELTGDGAWRKV